MYVLHLTLNNQKHTSEAYREKTRIQLNIGYILLAKHPNQAPAEDGLIHTVDKTGLLLSFKG